MFAPLFHRLTTASLARLLMSFAMLWLTTVAPLKAEGPAQPGEADEALVPLGSGLELQVNPGNNRHSISPYIYGMNFADENLARELKLPVRRWGGNHTTRYNWQVDTSNRGKDWYFENVPNDNPNPGQLPNGSETDRFVEQDRRTGTRTLLTIPMIGWTPKARDYSCSFSVSKYGTQEQTDSQWRPDCGNGVRSGGALVTGNSPYDTSKNIDPTFVQQWLSHLIGRYGRADQGGVAFYNLDNEPMLWNSTHRDVHSAGASYDEIRDLTYRYARAIKNVDPSAKTLGPVEWGWTGYFYSARDSEPGGSWWDNPRDRNAHGGTPFIEWYLQQMRAYEQQQGVRILDYLDLHIYPQQAGVYGPTGGGDTQALRLRSTRALWDPNYRDESWINEPVRLIPRMRDWVNNFYPGTKLAISEYNFGGLDSMNGALAQADILGIFGREALDLATMWEPPQPYQPGAFAFRMYRNYDGAGSTFGETSIQASSNNQDQLAIYGAERWDGSLTLMVINKTGGQQSANLVLNNFTPAGNAQVYRYSQENLGGITRQGDITVKAGGVNVNFPGSSITLLVVPKGYIKVTGPYGVKLPMILKK